MTRRSYQDGGNTGDPRKLLTAPPPRTLTCRLCQTVHRGNPRCVEREKLPQLLLGLSRHRVSSLASTAAASRRVARARDAVARTELTLTPIASEIAASSRSA